MSTHACLMNDLQTVRAAEDAFTQRAKALTDSAAWVDEVLDADFRPLLVVIDSLYELAEEHPAATEDEIGWTTGSK